MRFEKSNTMSCVWLNKTLKVYDLNRAKLECMMKVLVYYANISILHNITVELSSKAFMLCHRFTITHFLHPLHLIQMMFFPLLYIVNSNKSDFNNINHNIHITVYRLSKSYICFLVLQ